MKKTPLFTKHQEAGGKIIDFGGWALPVQYRGIIDEHNAVRTRAGLFDVSHMGELWLQGPDVASDLQRLVTNDISKTQVGQAVYSPMCNEQGGVVDDLLLYRVSEQQWMLVVNAANTDKDEAWIGEHTSKDTHLTNHSLETAQLALQGPRAEAILQRLTMTDISKIRFFRFEQAAVVADVPVLLSRTGYTGEDGFELYFNAADAPMLWERLLDEGYADGLEPAGLGARDTLRFEAALPLYGQELASDISPLEAGLNRFVKLDKPAFIGREKLLEQAAVTRRRIIGLEMVGRGVPRSHYSVQHNGQPVGQITSGTYAPTVQKYLALALVASSLTETGTMLDVMIRERPVPAVVVPLPFYSRRRT